MRRAPGELNLRRMLAGITDLLETASIHAHVTGHTTVVEINALATRDGRLLLAGTVQCRACVLQEGGREL